MCGLVMAVASERLPLSCLEQALGVAALTGGWEVPLAPAGALVLAECCFKDGIFAAPKRAMAVEAEPEAEVEEQGSVERQALRAMEAMEEQLVGAMSSAADPDAGEGEPPSASGSALQHEFDAFVAKLGEVSQASAK